MVNTSGMPEHGLDITFRRRFRMKSATLLEDVIIAALLIALFCGIFKSLAQRLITKMLLRFFGSKDVIVQ